MRDRIVLALCAVCLLVGWFVRSWYEDSVSLAVERIGKQTQNVAATAISGIKVEQNNIYNRTVEHMTRDVVYKECKADTDMMLLTNKAITGE